MKIVFILQFVLLSLGENDACFPTRSRGPLHSYLPATIQILHHYKDQLRRYYPYAFSTVCRFGNSRKPKETEIAKDGDISRKLENGTFISVPEGADFCVFPTDSSFSRLLRDLYIEAKNKNLQEFQGFSYRVLLQLEKTSNMTSADQLHFIFDNLLKEKITTGPVTCKIYNLMDDLKVPSSKLYRNLLLGPQCNCQCSNNRNNLSRNFESLSTIRDEGYGNKFGERKSEYSSSQRDPLDERTKQQLSSMRQKACRFIISQSECSSEAESCCNPSNCQNRNNGGGGNLIKQARESIDYIPQSEFLRKFSAQCNCKCSDKNQKQRSFSANENHSMVPRVCQECIVKSTEIIKLLELLHNQGFTADNQESSQTYGSCRCCSEQEGERNGINRIVKTCRSVVDELKNVLTNMGPCLNEEDYNRNNTGEESQNMDDYYNERDSHGKKQKSKSQHVSRSKKRVKCRGRRKKSNGSEKCHSQENFEPSLKKPYETSCDRCWRYASPSRSPVNKPSQRYDPNFRRAHSAQDLLSNVTERNDDDVEVFQSNPSPGRSQHSANRRTRDQVRQQECDETSTRVKDLMLQYPDSRSQTRYQKDRTCDEIERYISVDHSDRKLRAKNNTPGYFSFERLLLPQKNKKMPELNYSLSPLSTGRGNLSSLDATEYKDIAYRKNQTPKESSFIKVDVIPSSYRDKSCTNNPCCTCRHDSEGLNSKGRSPRNPTRPASVRNEESVQDTSSRGYQRATSGRNNVPNGVVKPSTECCCHKTQNSNGGGNRYQPTSSGNNAREQMLPVRTQSSVFGQMSPRSPSDTRPRTRTQYDARRSPSGEYQTQFPGQRSSSANRVKDSMQMRCADHQNSTARSKQENYLEEIKSPCKARCCHCSLKKANDQTNSYDRSSPTRNRTLSGPEMNENYFPSQENGQPCSRRPESQGCKGTKGPCPHRANRTDNDSPNGRNFADNQRYYSRGKESGRGERVSSPGGQTGSYQSTPKKYCVFYMTKSKSDNANDVEVLVEELTERRNEVGKDSKMSDLKDKMRRVEVSPLESMALRFQKGVCESTKNLRPESSRILYF
ncbi:hypothetical protein RUM44_012281 [Polyplax serrata]|uniref:Uncharacterized protein n=1 Tax=Polyplax serrata TaxID=468196 RepID=A0ABR1BCZ6_POLSC